ncbi:MAG TPA: hypothetical protein VKA09_16470 [Nitrososphaeraceae archaeon]|nr:hypothetical protein [Nitrososphaeraceae archaeon]
MPLFYNLVQRNLILVVIDVAVAMALVAVAVFYAGFPSKTANAADSNSSAVLIGRDVYNESLDTWAQKYWQWSLAIPFAQDIPIDPQTQMSKCIVGSDQNGTMLFLVDPYDNKYTTKCTISSGKPILVPLLIGECDRKTSDPRIKPGEIEGLWACAKDFDEVFRSWDVTLDNMTLTRKAGNEEVNPQLINDILVRNSSTFILDYPENNRWGLPSGPVETVVDGYYLILKPLDPGEHLLKYKITHEQKSPGADLSYIYGDVTYLLDVT